MTSAPWTIETGDDPIVATAIHAGNQVRAEVAAIMKLADDDRFREEDPYTDLWAGIARNSIVAHRSRFEVDLNRPREKAVYVDPADAWGLDIWTTRPTESMVAESLALYDEFYRLLGELCDEVVARHGHVVVIDLHSYNHRRGGPSAAVDDPELNPEINLGTESIVAERWEPIVAGFASAMAEAPFDDATIDVRSNVRFRGGNMSRWLNARYEDRGCSIAVEVKKIYLDEWTGALDEDITAAIGRILDQAAEAVRVELGHAARP